MSDEKRTHLKFDGAVSALCGRPVDSLVVVDEPWDATCGTCGRSFDYHFGGSDE